MVIRMGQKQSQEFYVLRTEKFQLSLEEGHALEKKELKSLV